MSTDEEMALLKEIRDAIRQSTEIAEKHSAQNLELWEKNERTTKDANAAYIEIIEKQWAQNVELWKLSERSTKNAVAAQYAQVVVHAVLIVVVLWAVAKMSQW